MSYGSLDRPRRSRSAQVAVVVVALALVSACQGSPGAAAVVGETTISMDQVDQLSEAYCQANVNFTELSGDTVVASEGKDSRRYVVGLLVQLELARQSAEDLGVSIAPRDFQVETAQYQPLFDRLGDTTADQVLEILESSTEASRLTEAIGAHELGSNLNEIDPTQARQAGLEYIQDYADSIDLELDPRLGLATDGSIVSDSGSLSVAVSDQALPIPSAAPGEASGISDLPGVLVCQ